jgi:hypothetical protein
MVSSPQHTPPVLLLNAAVACVALISVKTAGPLLDNMIPEPSLLTMMNVDDNKNENENIQKDSGNNTNEAAISLLSE